MTSVAKYLRDVTTTDAAPTANLTEPTGPVILGSHSLADEIATAVVNIHPDLDAGAVLIDANVSEFFTRSDRLFLFVGHLEWVALRTPDEDPI